MAHGTTNGTTKSHGGAFKRSAAQFRNWVTSDGAGPGREGFSGKRPLSSLCIAGLPRAHRTRIFRQLKGLADHAVSVVHPDMLDKGWTFERDDTAPRAMTSLGSTHASGLYQGGPIRAG